MADPNSHPEFNVPFFRTADVVLDATGGANDEGEIDPSDFTGQNTDSVIDKVIVFENSLRDPAADPGADTQLLGNITGRYYFSQSHPGVLPEVPLAAWDSGHVDRTVPVIHGMQEPYDFAIVAADLRRCPLVVPRNGALRCDWTNPTKTSAGAIPAGTLHLAASCRLRQSRRHVDLYLPLSVLASAGGAVAGPSATQYDQRSSRNQWPEELELYEVRAWVDGNYGSAANWADTRLLRHLRIRPFIVPGDVDLWGSTIYLPVVGCGTGRQLDHAVATMDWSDEPPFVPSSDGLGCKFTNNGSISTRVTVVQACRRRPEG